ncbi:hypothetical protein BSKO_06021 [Bryopsis sp. KO-2023]|nr:hypothetical protein BSKO_06021 [Bryopsis sp. KO-2023]
MIVPTLFVLLGFAGSAAAQTITFTGGIGCAVLNPGPPAGLRAAPGNGKVTLQWDDPRNGACVDEYTVDVQIISDRRSFFDWELFRTPEHKVVIDELENGVEYKFTVKVELCWDGVTNSGCVDEFKVRAALVEDNTRFFFDIPEKISKGGCVTVDNLDNHRAYEFTVQSWSRRFRRGGSSSITATPKPKNAWRCVGVPNSYKKCQAAVWGTCQAYSCKEQARNGQCSASWMQEVDWDTRTITQHCSDYCGCPSKPSSSNTRTFLLDDHCCRNDGGGPFSTWLNNVLD